MPAATTILRQHQMGWDGTEEPGEPSREPSAGFVRAERSCRAAAPAGHSGSAAPAPKPPAQHAAPAERWRTNACSQAKPVTGSSFYFQDHQHCLCYCLEYFEEKKRGDTLPCNLFTTLRTQTAWYCQALQDPPRHRRPVLCPALNRWREQRWKSFMEQQRNITERDQSFGSQPPSSMPPATVIA